MTDTLKDYVKYLEDNKGHKAEWPKAHKEAIQILKGYIELTDDTVIYYTSNGRYHVTKEDVELVERLMKVKVKSI